MALKPGKVTVAVAQRLRNLSGGKCLAKGIARGDGLDGLGMAWG